MNLSELSLRSLQQAIQRGDLSAREVAQQTLRGIERHRAINAWTEVTDERMLREADAVDAQRRRGDDLPPLAGVP